MRCDRVRGGRPARADWAEQDAGSQDKAGHAGGGRPGAEQDVMGFSLDTCVCGAGGTSVEASGGHGDPSSTGGQAGAGQVTGKNH